MNIPESTRQKVRDLVSQGERVGAVKLLRTELKVSLAKAARALDFIVDGVNPDVPMPMDTEPDWRKVPRAIRVMLISFLLAGLGMTYVAISTYRAELAFRATHVLKPAKMVQFVPAGGRFRPIFEFSLNGETRTAPGTDRVRNPERSRAEFQAGSGMVWVSPENPTEARPNSWAGSWTLTLVFGILGAGFTFVSASVLILLRGK